MGSGSSSLSPLPSPTSGCFTDAPPYCVAATNAANIHERATVADITASTETIVAGEGGPSETSIGTFSETTTTLIITPSTFKKIARNEQASDTSSLMDTTYSILGPWHGPRTATTSSATDVFEQGTTTATHGPWTRRPDDSSNSYPVPSAFGSGLSLPDAVSLATSFSRVEPISHISEITTKSKATHLTETSSSVSKTETKSNAHHTTGAATKSTAQHALETAGASQPKTLLGPLVKALEGHKKAEVLIEYTILGKSSGRSGLTGGGWYSEGPNGWMLSSFSEGTQSKTHSSLVSHSKTLTHGPHKATITSEASASAQDPGKQRSSTHKHACEPMTQKVPVTATYVANSKTRIQTTETGMVFSMTMNSGECQPKATEMTFAMTVTESSMPARSTTSVAAVHETSETAKTVSGLHNSRTRGAEPTITEGSKLVAREDCSQWCNRGDLQTIEECIVCLVGPRDVATSTSRLPSSVSGPVDSSNPDARHLVARKACSQYCSKADGLGNVEECVLCLLNPRDIARSTSSVPSSTSDLVDPKITAREKPYEKKCDPTCNPTPGSAIETYPASYQISQCMDCICNNYPKAEYSYLCQYRFPPQPSGT